MMALDIVVDMSGFVMRSGDFECRFLHDRMQQAAYECVPTGQNKQMHLEVAQFLMTKVNINEDSTVRHPINIDLIIILI
jgi:hypothetical protein